MLTSHKVNTMKRKRPKKSQWADVNSHHTEKPNHRKEVESKRDRYL